MNQHSVKKVKSTNLCEGKTGCSVEMWICTNPHFHNNHFKALL